MEAGAQSSLLSVRDLSVAFSQGGKETLAVDRVSFDIAKGETVALVGESGSGKSVTALSVLKLLAYPPASHPSGAILFKGEDLLAKDERQLRKVRGNQITMIFQEPMTSLNPLHTIEQQVGEVLTLHQGMGDAQARRKTLELLNEVGIREPEKRLDAYPHQLSGGQRQRVMIAMALANEPDLLIADEPTTALDVTVQAQILELLARLKARKGMSMLFITHDLGIVRKIADRVCVMTKGKIVETGPTQEIFAHPQHPYTKHLLAAEPKGRPPKADESAETVMKGDGVKVWFPIKQGFFRRTVDHVKAVDGIDVTVRAGQTLGVVGEFGVGQDDARAGAVPDDLVERDDPLRRPRHRQAVVQRDATAAPGAADRVPGPVRLAQPAHVGQRDHRRGAADPRAGAVRSLSAIGASSRRCTRWGSTRTTRHRYPHEFSGGQRQRIAIARAMVLNPRFVMLDEPTSALDMSVQAQVVDLLRDLQAKHNLAYLFISHDLKVVRALANEVVVMRNGKVVEHGTSEEIFERPRSEYTRALISAAFRIEAAPTGAVSQ